MDLIQNMALHSLIFLNLLGYRPAVHPPKPPTGTLVFAADYYPFGKHIHAQASFPKAGGKIQGEVTGDCSGEIEGQYSGDEHGKQLHGTVETRCPLFLFTVKANAIGQGSLNSDDKWANVNYTAFIDNHRITGSYSFPLTSN